MAQFRVLTLGFIRFFRGVARLAQFAQTNCLVVPHRVCAFQLQGDEVLAVLQ